MGDRCSVHVTLRRKDLDAFGAETGWSLDDEPIWTESEGPTPDSVRLDIEEVNYGGDEELLAAARACIPFFGYHDAGCCYGPQEFASCGGAILRVDITHDGDYGVSISRVTRQVDGSSLLFIRRYFDVLDAAEALVTGKEDADVVASP